MSKGNLQVEVQQDRKDVIGSIFGALSRTLRKFLSVIGGVHHISKQVARGSIQIEQSSEVVAEGANQQAVSSEEISSTMEEMVVTISQNSLNAKDSEIIIEKAFQEVSSASETANETAEKIQMIADKTNVIKDIAIQTNLLALNAAVEASRAGEFGRGFAVVAAEVRKLANRSQQASDDISKLTSNGVELSEQLGTQLQELVPEMEKTVNLVKEISVASAEQSSGAEQVNLSIQHLSKVIASNSSASSDMVSNTSKLKQLAEEMENSIKFFNI